MSRVSKHKVPRERIQQLRICVAVHSYIYYEMCDNLVSDHQWQSWADELVLMHAKYPEYTDDYDKYWEDFDGSTGFHLCNIPGLHQSALRIMRYAHEQS